MPLNNQASLTETLPIKAGETELFPKQTLTNQSAFSNGDIGSKWDASTTGSPYNGSWDVVFDGNASASTSTQGPSYWHYTYESTTSVTLRESISGQIEILAGRPGSNDSGTHSITLGSQAAAMFIPSPFQPMVLAVINGTTSAPEATLTSL